MNDDTYQYINNVNNDATSGERYHGTVCAKQALPFHLGTSISHDERTKIDVPTPATMARALPIFLVATPEQ